MHLVVTLVPRLCLDWSYTLPACRSRHQWIAFIDVDEFFVIRDRTVGSLPQLLREYTDYGALAVNWQVLHMHCWQFHNLTFGHFLCILYQQARMPAESRESKP